MASCAAAGATLRQNNGEAWYETLELVEERVRQRAVPQGQKSAEERSASGMESLVVDGSSKQRDV